MMNKFLTFLTLTVLTACGGGGGGAAPEPAPVPAPPPLSIEFSDSSHSTDEDVQISDALNITTNRAVSLSYSLDSEPVNGSVSFSGTNFTYIPNLNYFGDDEFEVTASAEGVSDSGKVSLTINSINDAPVVNIDLGQTDGSDFPLLKVGNTMSINISAEDVESQDSLEISANVSFEGVGSSTSISVDTAANTADFSGIPNSGPLSLTVSASDGEVEVSETVNFWRAKPIQNTVTDAVIYNLYGDSNNTDRGFRYVLLTDSIPSTDLQKTIQDSFKFYFSDFLIETGEMRQLVTDMFNVVVIEPALNTSPINVVINEEVNCSEGFDPNIFCINEIKPRLFDYVEQFFEENYFDNYSIITGKDGRGVNGGNANIQQIATEQDGICSGNVYCKGPRNMLKTFKHEFGHGYLETGDGYVSDFQRTDDDGNPLYEDSYFQAFRYGQDNWVNTTYEQDESKYKWRHKIADIENIPSDDNASDTSNSAVGKWTGCYSQDTNCFRSTYNSVMNGDKGGNTEWLSDGERTSVTYFDTVDHEAFVIKSWIQQGLHDVSVGFDEDGNLVVSHQLKLNPQRYDVYWYINGVIQENLTNSTSVTIPDDDTFISVAYRVLNILDDAHVTVADEINLYGDTYNGTFSTYNNLWYCDGFRDVSTLWDGLTIRTYCPTTQLFYFKSGASSTWPGYGTTFDEIKARGDVRYMYEVSSRGAQIVIDLNDF